MLISRKASNMDVKRINKINIFRCIFNKEKISQQDIASILDISVPTVLQNVNELLELGLVQSVGVFESTGGRKAKVIAPISDAKYAVGLDITQNHISMILVDLAGQILDHTRFPCPFSYEEAYFRKLGVAITEFVQKTGVLKEKILGVGISIPGIIDKFGKKITYSHALGISDVPCIKFSEYIPYHCSFNNDANAAGFAELRNLNPVHNAVYLNLSNSVGGAILLNNSLYLGENLRSGELGHNAIVINGKQCYCGKRGCLDAYCSAKVLSQHSDDNLPAFFEKLKAGDEACQSIWEEYFGYLAVTINNLRMTFDCDIIVGGYVGSYLEDYLPQLKETLATLNTFENDGNYVKVCCYKLEASAMGAALQLIENFVDQL